MPLFVKRLKSSLKNILHLKKNKKELTQLGDQLSKNPKSGISLGKNCYKIRLAIASKGKGKSGGARVITHFYVAEDTVFLLSVFDKSEKENISDKQIKSLLELIH